MKILYVEWLKTKRTALRLLTFCFPVVYAALIIGYVALRGIDKNTQTLVFQTFFEAWTACIIPLGIGILSGLIVHQEELAGNFNGLLSSKVSRYGLYGSKFILLVLTMTASTLIAAVALGVGLDLFLGVTISWPIFIAASILAIIGAIPLLALHLWAGFRWGMGASIGISIGGLLMAALMGATNLGDKIWQFIPWTWPVRLAMLSGAYLQFSEDMQFPPAVISSGFVLKQLAMGLAASLLCLAAALIGGIIWFNRWEGRKSYD
ncbi:lantibiotic ABC transporter [Clostridium thermosuccinogenes]|uniref:Lantibiotic ABC transporter n=2 Tax=Clostridium thermosuccinogenes TaxID=84032 RepID=A0A2K2EXT2_9CLOT|nr:lantibiotic ABC transporter [Pseudoclostridium thermosuccinogenes]PNT91339.1 lantibiotic ABC transporter [Pseudoclostridium thermosuccinogenes]PNT95717.1 lantibiotic ABC transporter [Pseudoclostridium thermosuccinogenes]PNT96974.1 lantibiotic ABC transporter [Pseudoclostridium thermosuccinogenes]